MTTAPWAPITQALVDHDEAALAAALRAGRVVVVMTDRESHVPVVLTDDAGVRQVVAFSSPESFALWDRKEHISLIPGAETARFAAGQPVDAVLFDPAGPAPVSLAPAYLQEVIDGIVHDDSSAGVLVADRLQLRPLADRQRSEVVAAITGLAPDSLELFLVERLVANRWLPTLAAYGPEAEVADLAGRLQEAPTRLPTLDVVAVPGTVLAELTRLLPQTRLVVGAD